MRTQAIEKSKPFTNVTSEGPKTMLVGEMSKSDRRRRLESLPSDLRERVRRRVMTVEQAQAWVRLRDAFHGDVETLTATLLTAYGVA